MSTPADRRPVPALGFGPRLLVALVMAGAGLAMASRAASGEECVPTGAWVVPGVDRHHPVPAATLFPQFARRSVVLLGESHDSAEDHRWQLATVAALHAARPDLALGFEMFPRRVQGALDRWTAGELSEAAFLKESDWEHVWGFEPALYLPLFHFARMHRLPMIALNVDQALVRRVEERGWEGVPEGEREGLTRPAPAPPKYLDQLMPIYLAHQRRSRAPATEASKASAGVEAGDPADPAFRRFVEAQLIWDRAMAEAIAAWVSRPGARLVVAVMGAGHVRMDQGVPYQLADLAVASTAVLLPWESGVDCDSLGPGVADAVFGVSPLPAPRVPPGERPRLGITLDDAGGRVRVIGVLAGSIAEAAGIRKDDVIVELAGVTARGWQDVAMVVRRQAPGTWLPLKVEREGAQVEIVARFPAAP